MVQLTFPFHKYVGPGNKLINGRPVDKADSLVAFHDIKYLNNNPEIIQESDWHFATDFFTTFWENFTICNLIGGLGLFGKYIENRIYIG